MLYVCIYVAPWSCEARHFVPLYVPTCSGMTIKLNLNLTWRKNYGKGLILSLRHCFAFSRRLEMYTTSSNAAALRTQSDGCMTLSKHRESYREQTIPLLSNRFRGTLMSYTDRSAARCCFRSNTPIVHFALCWNKSGNFSPPPLRKSKIIKYKSILR